MNKNDIERIIPIIKKGGIGVMPTDTLYGLVGSALNKKAVERIYAVRKRTPSKPMIILLSSLKDLEFFHISLDAATKKIVKTLWPGKVSVALNCPLKKFTYLHRGAETLAFRLPNNAWLKKLLKQTGPLVAPSANCEGKKPAQTIDEAKKYFGDQVDFYVDGGKLVSKPSTLIKIGKGQYEIVRQGGVKMK